MKSISSPLVSIVMPAYNSIRFIDSSIRSVLNQTYTNFELIIVDDCSTDNTVYLVEQIMKEDNRVRLIKLTSNQGVVNARNTAIKNARGRFIAFLDSDDIWHTEKLNIQIKVMLKNDYAMTYTNYAHIDEDDKLIKNVECPSSINYKQALYGNRVGCLTVILDKEKIQDILMVNVKHEDYATWLKILKKNICAFGIQETLAYYRKSQGSLSSNKLKTISWTWNIYRNCENKDVIRSSYFIVVHLYRSLLKHYFS